MGQRSLILLLAACSGTPAGPSGPAGPAAKPATLPERVVADFEGAVKQSQDAFVGEFRRRTRTNAHR